MATREHTILIRSHSLNGNALAVVCTCGFLYEEPAYETLNDGMGELYGVKLSTLMDIAEAHQHDEDLRDGII